MKALVYHGPGIVSEVMALTDGLGVLKVIITPS